jgi:hypothetical protein
LETKVARMSVFYERDVILKDLRQHVIEMVLENSNNMRLTLREDLLPANYKDEKHLVEEYHNNNKDSIAGFNVKTGQWVSLEIPTIKYLQVIDGY